MTDSLVRIVEEMRGLAADHDSDGELALAREVAAIADRIAALSAPAGCVVVPVELLSALQVLESEEVFLRIAHGDDTANEHMNALIVLRAALAAAPAVSGAGECPATPMDLIGACPTVAFKAGWDARTTPEGFNNADALADWLESLHEMNDDGALTCDKWEPAQRAAAAIRAPAGWGVVVRGPARQSPMWTFVADWDGKHFVTRDPIGPLAAPSPSVAVSGGVGEVETDLRDLLDAAKFERDRAEQRAEAMAGLLSLLRGYVHESMDNDQMGDRHAFNAATLASIDALLTGQATPEGS